MVVLSIEMEEIELYLFPKNCTFAIFLARVYISFANKFE